MTEYWVSTKKHYCETCKCWLSAHKLNIKNHERSTRHLENFRKLLSQSSARREQETQEQEFLEKELQKLDRIEKHYLDSLNKNEKQKNNNNNTINNNNKTIHSNNKTIHNNNKNIENKIAAANTSDNYFRSVSPLPSKGNPSTYGDTQKEPKQNETRNEYMNWLVMIDANTGRLVYLNKENREVTQEPPKNFSGDIPKQEAFTEQNGWHKHFDFYANCFYYYNLKTAQFIWEYSSHNINSFIAYVKQWENANMGNYLATNSFNYVGSNSSYANYWHPNNFTINSYPSNGNDSGNYTGQFNEWYLQGFDKEKKENQKNNKNEINEPEKVYVSLNLNKQKNHGGNEQQGNNQTDFECLENNSLMKEIEKKEIESTQNKSEQKKTNTGTITDGDDSKADTIDTKDINVEKKNEQVSVRKKRVSRWDQRSSNKEEEQVKEFTEQAVYEEKEKGGQTMQKGEGEDMENEMVNTKEERKETEEEVPKKKMKISSNTEELGEGKLNEPNKHLQDKKNNNAGMPGTWEVVENPAVQTIAIDNVEDIFYKIKSRDQLEQEELSNLEEHIKDEYSQYNQFYVKKIELQNADLFLNQEFQFVNKPVFIKATDKKNMQKEKVTFAKRSIKAKNKKGDISNAN